MELDSRPLVLFTGEVSSLIAGAIVLEQGIYRMELSPVGGFGGFILRLLMFYPFLVFSLFLYRIRMGIFAEESGEPGFNLAGDVSLIGALFFPLLLGVPLLGVGRFIEMISLWNMSEVGERSDRLPFVTPGKIAGIVAFTLLLGGTLYHALTPEYDVTLVNKEEKVALYGNFYSYGL